MNTYLVAHIDQGKPWATDKIECPDDSDIIVLAHRLDAMAEGFDIWDGGRLVHRYRREQGRLPA